MHHASTHQAPSDGQQSNDPKAGSGDTNPGTPSPNTQGAATAVVTAATAFIGKARATEPATTTPPRAVNIQQALTKQSQQEATNTTNQLHNCHATPRHATPQVTNEQTTHAHPTDGNPQQRRNNYRNDG